MSMRESALSSKRCPVCQSPSPVQGAEGAWVQIDCPGCGTYQLTLSAVHLLANWNLNVPAWTAIAYRIKKMTGAGTIPGLKTETLEALRDAGGMPDPNEIIDDLVLWFGRKSHFPGETFNLDYPDDRVLVGAIDKPSFGYMVDAAAKSGHFDGSVTHDAHGDIVRFLRATLSPKGWLRYRELSTAQAASRHAFMAMQFGDPRLDTLVSNHFRPAVESTGFDLRRLDDGQPAGLIDDQLRTRIRTARFVIVDLTHANKGAYWEAGFAEGVGRPVIYTCEKSVFSSSDKAKRPHFDTNHLVTILWEESAMADAARRLKNTIRATLPDEAKLED